MGSNEEGKGRVYRQEGIGRKRHREEVKERRKGRRKRGREDQTRRVWERKA